MFGEKYLVFRTLGGGDEMDVDPAAQEREANSATEFAEELKGATRLQLAGLKSSLMGLFKRGKGKEAAPSSDMRDKLLGIAGAAATQLALDKATEKTTGRGLVDHLDAELGDSEEPPADQPEGKPESSVQPDALDAFGANLDQMGGLSGIADKARQEVAQGETEEDDQEPS